ncbi:hypothetical protein SAMN02745857_02789 [Andreprevotia lacus DSM 23236]|uniref:Uncharacterized protein n=1 Tax=Andreprevotia lacus DSM 23236 TaxID=1121001 RepID=A0A1W1XUU1_9NEIS|nr:hypothetical protein SAMN02745857_02789 [Andreprevotia lacus DSM 23236]
MSKANCAVHTHTHTHTQTHTKPHKSTRKRVINSTGLLYARSA